MTNYIADAAGTLRKDGIYNTATGLGLSTSDRGKCMAVEDMPFLTQAELDVLWAQNWLAQRVVRAVVDHAMVRGFEIDEDTDGSKLKAWRKLNHERYSEGALQRAHYLSGVYGGGGVFLGYGAGGGALDRAPPEAGKLEFLDAFSCFDLQATQRYEKKNDPKLRFPEQYLVQGSHPRNEMEFHETRLLRVVRSPAVKKNQKEEDVSASPEWGISLLQPIWDDLGRYAMAWAAAGNLLQEASTPVFTLKNLHRAIAQKGRQFLIDRMVSFNHGSSILKSVVLEEGEEYRRESVSFASLPQTLQAIIVSVAGAAGIPVTVLFKQAPSGLSATGESDLRQWDDYCAAYQTLFLKPQIEFLLGAHLGTKVTITFPPLKTPTQLELEQVRNLRITGDRIVWESSLGTDKTWASALAAGIRIEDSDEFAAGVEDLDDQIDSGDEPDNSGGAGSNFGGAGFEPNGGRPPNAAEEGGPAESDDPAGDEGS